MCQGPYCQPFEMRRVSHSRASSYWAEHCNILTAINLTPIWENRSKDLEEIIVPLMNTLVIQLLLAHPQWCSTLGCCWNLETLSPNSYPGITQCQGSHLSAPPQETQTLWVASVSPHWAHRNPWKIHFWTLLKLHSGLVLSFCVLQNLTLALLYQSQRDVMRKAC